MNETIATAGILTTRAPIVCRDGKAHSALFAPRWLFLPGEAVGIASPFAGRSGPPAAPWFALATMEDSDDILALVPGSDVLGFVAVDDDHPLPEGDWFDLELEEEA